MRRLPLPLLAVLTALFAWASPAAAQNRAVPYWASLRPTQVNLHVGPSVSYGVAWVYKRQHLPMKVLRLKEGWRLVEDPDGARGWMLARFLSPDRWAVVRGSAPAEMRAEGDAGAQLLWRLAPGVVGKLGDCDAGWCKLDLDDGHIGYVAQDRLWGGDGP